MRGLRVDSKSFFNKPSIESLKKNRDKKFFYNQKPKPEILKLFQLSFGHLCLEHSLIGFIN